MRLTTFLLRRILISGGVVLAATIAWLVTTAHQDVQHELNKSISSMQRILELQFTGLPQTLGLEPRFPFWYPITQVPRPDGTCVRLFDDAGTLLRSACRGIAADYPREPQWFASAYQAVFSPDAVISRELRGGKISARLELKADPTLETGVAWQRAAQLVVPAAFLIGVLCAIVGWSIHRALAPTQTIMSGLAALEHGALETRLGPFRWTEFDRIAQAVNTLAESLSASRIARGKLSRRLMQVQEEERLALAQELHDEFGQHLTAVGANAAALRGALDDPNFVADARRIENSVGYLSRLVHERLLQLRPWTAGEGRFSDAIQALVNECSASCGTHPSIALCLDGALDQLPQDIAGAAYRIAQEGLTNALRHADAREVDVRLERAADTLTVTIADDGRGCQHEQLESGFGVAGIRERAAAYNGQAFIETAPGQGLKISVHFQLSPESLAAA